MSSKKINKKIRRFFDDMSYNRNRKISTNLIVNYEQEMRQKSVLYLLDLKKNNFVLDIGCGNARDLLVLAKKGIKCVGVDSSGGMVDEGLKILKRYGFNNLKIYKADARTLPFKNNTFDKIILSEVIEHIPDYKNAIKECKRVLKKEGILVITTPNWHSLYGINRLILETIRVFIRLIKPVKKIHPYDKWKTQKEVIKILEEEGFRINKKIGICFIPSYTLTYYLSNQLKKIIIKTTSFVEERLNKILTGKGYMIGVSAIKT